MQSIHSVFWNIPRKHSSALIFTDLREFWKGTLERWFSKPGKPRILPLVPKSEFEDKIQNKPIFHWFLILIRMAVWKPLSDVAIIIENVERNGRIT